MERVIRRYFWLLSGALILIAAPVAASTPSLLTDFKPTRLIPGLSSEGDASSTGTSPAIVNELATQARVVPAFREGATQESESTRHKGE